MHFFGKKNRLSFSPELQKVKISDAIGKSIVCEDGKARRVHEIVYSYRWPWRVIVNEKDPESHNGYYVNMLSLSSQLLGKGVPDQDAQDAFAKSIRVKFNIGTEGITKSHPYEERQSGRIWLPSNK